MTIARGYLHSLGVAGPGLAHWQEAQSVLRGEQPYVASDLGSYQPTLLPANERRRASPAVRIAFRVAEEATRDAPAHALATTFVSADGDLQIAHRLCTALATPERFISPTDFHNSVHNAAAGYWSIATAAHGPSTAISGWDQGFAVGLLETMAMVEVEGHETLLVAYDLPAPEPLWLKRPLAAPFGVALVIGNTPKATSLAVIEVEVCAAQETALANEALEQLRRSNPAARALPLLHALATRSWGTHYLHWTKDNALGISLNPA